MGNDAYTISWFESSPRAVISLEKDKNFKISRSLKQVIKKNIFTIKFNNDFKGIINECANREDTWINRLIINAYCELHKRGYAHSIEAYHGSKLAGGLYGVAYRGAFFGESMFYKVSNASKVCVVKLYEILMKNNYILWDIQMMTPHFKRFGAKEISKKDYLELLDKALAENRKFIYK